MPRNDSEIVEAEQEFFDIVWYVRSVVHSDEEIGDLPDDIWTNMLAARRRIEDQYGKNELEKMIDPGHDAAWEYGYASGKLAALTMGTW